jgi:hypothetical protein
MGVLDKTAINYHSSNRLELLYNDDGDNSVRSDPVYGMCGGRKQGASNDVANFASLPEFPGCVRYLGQLKERD